MKMSFCLRGVLMMLAVSTAGLVSAQTSGLVSAPSMKVHRVGQFQIQYRQTSIDAALDSPYKKNLQILYGLAPGLEIGFDSNLGGETGMGAKYSYLIDPAKKLRFTIGAQDITTDSQLFMGLMKEFGDYDLHFGFIDRNKGQVFVGYRTYLRENLRFTADHITGSHGSTGGRLDVKIGPFWSLDTRIYFPNDTNRARTHRFGVSYQCQLGK